jgi:putative glutamine amidotransferase
MKMVAVTMLRSYDEGRSEWRSAIDERWVRILTQCGLTPVFLPNHGPTAASLLHSLQPIGLLLTGGGNCSAISGSSDARDETEQVALTWAQSAVRPVFGVCRGMQVLLAATGVRLVPVERHVAVRHSLVGHGQVRRVNSYHRYAAFDAAGWQVCGRSEDGVVEWVRDPLRRWEGIMWHPEREPEAAPQDLKLIKNLFLGA